MKEERVGSVVIFEGREFQMVEAAKKKERRQSSDERMRASAPMSALF